MGSTPVPDSRCHHGHSTSPGRPAGIAHGHCHSQDPGGLGHREVAVVDHEKKSASPFVGCEESGWRWCRSRVARRGVLRTSGNILNISLTRTGVFLNSKSRSLGSKIRDFVNFLIAGALLKNAPPVLSWRCAAHY